jgi:predicted CXXCH cytochrome family protein
MVWPGPTPPARPSGDWGKCVNCHNPHGYKDATGLVPNQTVARNENLCYPCHDGSPAPDARSDFFNWSTHPSRHPVDSTDPLHVSPRIVACDDCHNPHAASGHSHTYSTTATSTRNQVSPALRGVSGIQFNYGGLGNFIAPTSGNFALIPATTGATYEYEICFKCHSSYNNWQGRASPRNGLSPNGSAINPVETDVAQEFNPNNKSGHPVVTGLDNYPNSTAVGSPLKKGLQANALLAPWKISIGQQTMMCSDCHNTDAGSLAAQGPHASALQFMLRGTNAANWPNITLSSRTTSWCVNCHPLATATGTITNNVHTDGNHSSRRCYECHTVIPHGGKMSRLIGDRETMPARYAYNNTLTTMQISAFRKAAYNSYRKDATGNCSAACATSDHPTLSGTGVEHW